MLRCGNNPTSRRPMPIGMLVVLAARLGSTRLIDNLKSKGGRKKTD